MDNEKWQVEGLIKRAFARTKDRFLSYFLTWVASFGMIIGAFLLLLVLGSLVMIASGIAKSMLAAVVLGIIIGIGFYIGFIYISSWIVLATIEVLISEEKLGVGATFAKVKPMVWGYFWMSFLAGLFMMGLMPWGILSLGVIFVLWALWSSFMAFAYLKFQKKGLQSLWISRQMFRQNPWGIFGRSLLLTVAIWAISIAINLVFGSMGKNGSMASSGISMIFSLLYAPFAMSFSYEMFSNLEAPKEEVKTPTVWVVFSVLGWALTILLVVLGIYLTYSRIFTNFGMKDLQYLREIDQTRLQEQLNKAQELQQNSNNQFNYPTMVPTFGSSSGTMGY
jgi:hypothetical protein